MEIENINLENDISKILCFKKDFIFEVSDRAPKILNEIDNIFRKLKKEPYDRFLIKNLVEKIREFSGIKNVSLVIKKNFFNASIVPIYKTVFLKSLKEDLINNKKNYVSDSNIEKISNEIEKIYIIIGSDIIKFFSPEETTSILLHELGHVFWSTSNAAYLLPILIKKFITVSSFTLTISKLLNLITISASLLNFLFFFFLFGIHGATFLERIHEYKADEFSIKYGYGEELLSVLKYFYNAGKKETKKISLLKRFLRFLTTTLSDIFSPKEHPPEKKRIDVVISKIKKEYIEMYPTLSSELSIILKEID